MIIDPKSTVPIYRQIVEQISRAIDAGVYQAGEALPSQRILAVELRVNPFISLGCLQQCLRLLHTLHELSVIEKGANQRV